MPPGQHHALRTLTVIEVDDFVEEECSSRGSGEPRRNQLSSVGQKRFAVHATKHPGAAQMGQVVPTHLQVICQGLLQVLQLGQPRGVGF